MTRYLLLMGVMLTACKPDIVPVCIHDCKASRACIQSVGMEPEAGASFRECVANCVSMVRAITPAEREVLWSKWAQCGGLLGCDWHNCVLGKPCSRDWALELETEVD